MMMKNGIEAGATVFGVERTTLMHEKYIPVCVSLEDASTSKEIKRARITCSSDVFHVMMKWKYHISRVRGGFQAVGSSMEHKGCLFDS